MKKGKSEYEIDRELTGKFAIEKNAEYQEKIEQLEEENKKLKDENEKLKDKFMLKLAEAYLLPPRSNQMAEYKKWNFYKWYDEIKNQMRKEIKEED